MKKYVMVGCGYRGIRAYAEPIVKKYGDCAELCGVYDINKKRAELVSEIAEKEIPVYDDFDKMLDDVKPDTVIITTKDSDHDYYAVKAMKKGCDIIVEKPLTTTFEKALAIKKAQEETGRDVTVTFNLRFHPFFKRVKELVAAGTIGKITSVHYEWLLDTAHGADYFHRWHCIRENSGSLLIHKSSHHFDFVNWLLEEDPVAVNAFGTRRFYGDVKEAPSERCFDCPVKSKCKYNCGMDSDGAEFSRKLYLECEGEDGYIRDRCVYSPRVDIEDSVCLNVMYSGGCIMSYTLTAHSPYEGVRLVLNGTEGRIEMRTRDFSQMGYDVKSERELKVFNYKGEEITMNIPLVTTTDHGGSDIELRDRMLRDRNLPDPLHQMADIWAGLMSLGIGMAANVSMAEKRQVSLSEFYDELKD
ncbi:MAG: Gfo/Idh/MocA family oxidoreductase [Clostridia bacterium]|nr:Gfo/Idh/MocA family oxidoreductase [Clostridia bacterium]